MQYVKVKDGYLLRLDKGEEIVSQITSFAKEKSINSGFINALGAVGSIELGFYHLDRKEYVWKKFEEDLEIASLSGNIAELDIEPVLHLHGVFSADSFETIGGHVKSAVVGATCEVFISDFEIPLSRKKSEEIGLNLLDI